MSSLTRWTGKVKKQVTLPDDCYAIIVHETVVNQLRNYKSPSSKLGAVGWSEPIRFKFSEPNADGTIEMFLSQT